MQLITYVTFTGNCEEAMNFYKDALGAEILLLNRMSDSPMDIPAEMKNKIMHARLKIGENVLYLSDTLDSKALVQGNNISLSLQPKSIAETEDVFTKLSAGGTVKMPLQDTFWGARFGMFVDKFGIHWMVNCGLKKETSLN